MRRRLKDLPPERFTREGLAAAARIMGLSIWRRYDTVLLFLSMKDEIDTSPLIHAAFNAGKKVFAPQIWSDTLRFFRMSNADASWKNGPFGIREPAEITPGNSLKREDFPALIFVPALAFDPQGRRLGRGKGFYDRFFAALETWEVKPYCTIGLCLAAQMLPFLPTDNWDKPVNALCTGENFTIIGDNYGTD